MQYENIPYMETSSTPWIEINNWQCFHVLMLSQNTFYTIKKIVIHLLTAENEETAQL